MRTLSCLMLALVFAAPSALAQDVEAGHALAQTWCAGCHNVTPTPKTVRDNGPPPFVALANAPGMTRTALQVFLQTSHGGMPDYSLTRKQIADVSAYIVSLKK